MKIRNGVKTEQLSSFTRQNYINITERILTKVTLSLKNSLQNLVSVSRQRIR